MLAGLFPDAASSAAATVVSVLPETVDAAEAREGGFDALLLAASGPSHVPAGARSASAGAPDTPASEADRWFQQMQVDFTAMHAALDAEESGISGRVAPIDEDPSVNAYVAPVPVPVPAPFPPWPPGDCAVMNATVEASDDPGVELPPGDLRVGDHTQSPDQATTSPALMAYATPIPVPVPVPLPGRPPVDSPRGGGAAGSPSGLTEPATPSAQGTPLTDGASAAPQVPRVPGGWFDVAGTYGQSGAPTAPASETGSVADQGGSTTAPPDLEPVVEDSARPNSPPLRVAARHAPSNTGTAVLPQPEASPVGTVPQRVPGDAGDHAIAPSVAAAATSPQRGSAGLSGAAIDALADNTEPHVASEALSSGRASTPDGESGRSTSDETPRQALASTIGELTAQAARGETERTGDTPAAAPTALPASVGATSAVARPPVVHGTLMPQLAEEAAPGAENVGRLIEAMRVQWRHGAQEASIRLSPEHYGEVTMFIRVDKGMVSAVVQAETPAVQQWLESQEERLRSGLSDHGLSLEKLTVQRDRPQGRREPQQHAPPRRYTQPRETGEHFDVLV